MNTPVNYYKQQINAYTTKLKQLNNKLHALSLLRLIAFIFTALGVYFYFEQWKIAITIAVIGLSVFGFLLSKYTNLKTERDLHKNLVDINEEEIKIASGDFHNRPSGLKFQDPSHFYSLDIDLFGKASFFQFINRTTITEGSEHLANTLKANNINNIIVRQQAIQELSKQPEWRQLYSATSSLIKAETPAVKIINWLKGHKTFLPKQVKWLPLSFSILSLLLFLFTAIGLINNPAFIGYWLIIGLAISGIYLKQINNLASNTDKVRDTFRQYATLLDLIENKNFKSDLLKEKQKAIKTKELKASEIFKSFAKSLDALDNRNNLIGAIFGNGFFLNDIKNAYKIEQWIHTHANTVEDWFKVVSFFDAYNSLGNYVFNHPEFVFPDIVNTNTTIKAKNLGHPLLNKNKRVNSNLTLNNDEFFIVTGANMAGKSTFLRTVSLHIVMANIGLPVCAESSKYSPIKLITSMRTTDSLTDDSSYFFSELTRLKFIVDTIKNERYFIILDEILKGTNSTDKAIGSKKFVEKLVASKATGIIATHDLSLCEIKNQLPQVKNYYFDAEIVNNELYFDYKLKQGICQNMNASFLLKKMEIV
ncbi:MutS-related protein [Neotamlana laminarinivorans]|uniref:DNA mismatch repair protein MutS n=1 Tax=Neotamlana laminarinivorans TaxID=2883124 RepID=A0A9X1L3Q2_9FLAO|nr:DNA mismatch repair protein MutS [Tamlana laminarinivorans]MCB4798492.1 DNA mismatch repair protein MutS [Tamlana laminarinivorans]